MSFVLRLKHDEPICTDLSKYLDSLFDYEYFLLTFSGLLRLLFAFLVLISLLCLCISYPNILFLYVLVSFSVFFSCPF